MCKHILNAKVAIRAPCCRKWYDCPECHAEKNDHDLLRTFEMTLACKKCKKVFRIDTRELEEADEYCPHCDNHYVVPARTPEDNSGMVVTVVGDYQDMIQDDRQPSRWSSSEKDRLDVLFG
eukprot:TRINITY_DN167_c0_g1_i1.p1 TRINITY_DN167_c0_g1~~TRINITY_DN167_c0_g1_i1.p1  ORF type:complete len:121 (-),score=19.80 TRINITY_DN167_c0_g1_i1:52-414(-)